ncbi:hypothetical protein BV22DRAFT_1010284, partial [Leucogyrophana mollusca]
VRSEEFGAWEYFPDLVDKLVDWAEVFKDVNIRDHSRDRVLIYKIPTDAVPDTVYSVSIQLQGVLKRSRLGRLGTWDGYVGVFVNYNLHLASQQLVLGSGGGDSDAAWQATIRSQPHVPVTTSDDPNNWFAAIQGEWDVEENVPVARVSADGNMTTMNHLLLLLGDFVEVGAEFDIVLGRDRNSRSAVKIFMSFHHVVQLASAEELRPVVQVRFSLRMDGDAKG